MASLSSGVLSFIDNALYNPTRNTLPYTDPTQKSVIRTHLLETLQNFPSLALSLDTFTSLNGAVSTLFKLSGVLSTVTVTVWVHQDYPYISPMVITAPDHSTSLEYLRAWRHPNSTLLGLLQALTTTFACRKADALDRVMATIQFDLLADEARHVEEIDALVALQAELRSRGESLDFMVASLEDEVSCLERLSEDLRLHAGVLNNWVNDHRAADLDGARLEVADEESWWVEWLSGERAVEDVMYALDKAVEDRVLGFDVYMREIRVLARQQFLLRAKLVKFKGPGILSLNY